MNLKVLNDKVYPAVGFCIYCGSKEKLQKEHILPFGLSGTAVLPKASCSHCARITGHQEQLVLRGPFWPVRIFRTLHSRTKHRDAPSHFPLTITRNEKEEIIELPFEEYPILLQFPVYPPPALLDSTVIATDLNGVWTTRFPNYEVPLGTEQWGQELILNIPSAFHLLVADRGWQGAHEIARVRSSAFTMPGLKGWRAVTLAHVEPGKAIAWFDEAAEFFAADALPVSDDERIARGGFWSGINQQLWAKYFYGRARLIESIRTPTEVKELLAKGVKALIGTESGWHSGEVSRFRVLINVLAKLVSDPLSFSSEDARREYELEIRMSEETEEDRLALTFISEAANAFRGFENEPASELTRDRLALALDALAKIPTIGPDVTNAVRPAIGKSALTAMLGPIRTWMHRSLEGITDEVCFRLILLRLLQSGLPLYAHIRHGPIEYGKDIVALLEVDGSVVLRHYQVKCGEIDKRKWRESKDEIEEMFLVPLNSFQLPVAPQRIEGVLVTNGHANPYVEPVIDGWLRSQRQDHGRFVEFMHLV